MFQKSTPIDPAKLKKSCTGETPQRLQPQLLSLVDIPPQGEEWLHEIKHDGYRMTITVFNGQVHLWTRNGYDWTCRLPSLVGPSEDMGLTSAAFDAELVCLDDEGRTDFSKLQSCVASHGKGNPLLYLFDLVHLNGYNLCRVPLIERKALLKRILDEHTDSETSVLRFSDHIVGEGDRVFEHACLHGLEGIVSKRLDSSYRPGRRSRSWLKVKNPRYHRDTAGPWRRR